MKRRGVTQEHWCHYRRCYQELSSGDLPKHKWNRQLLSTEFMVAHYFILWIPSVLLALALLERNLVCWHKLIMGARRQSISSSKLMAKNDRRRTLGCTQAKREREENNGMGNIKGGRTVCKVLQQLPIFKDKHANENVLNCRSSQWKCCTWQYFNHKYIPTVSCLWNSWHQKQSRCFLLALGQSSFFKTNLLFLLLPFSIVISKPFQTLGVYILFP